MPKNKRPNRKPGGKTGKRAATHKTQGGPAEAGAGAANVKGAKTYGAPKSSRASFTPAMSRRSARGR